jgi:putative Mg2+ transporter-C (MgtC) family protein
MELYFPILAHVQIIDHLNDLLVLVAAFVLGGIIGYERERHDQPAGLRTHIILCVGSALITLVSLEVAEIYKGADPGRIAAQIVSGIGFLGAGAILKYGTTVRGLTTATSLWTVAGIGMALGFRLWIPAVLATIFVYVAMEYLRKLEGTIFVGRAYRTISVTCQDAKGLISQVHTAVEDLGLKVHRFEVLNLILEKKIQLHIYAKVPPNLDVAKLQEALSQIAGVVEVEIS